jgi:hypothetical protein
MVLVVIDYDVPSDIHQDDISKKGNGRLLNLIKSIIEKGEF